MIVSTKPVFLVFLFVSTYPDDPDDIGGSEEYAQDTDNGIGGIWTSIVGEDVGPPNIPFIWNPGPKRIPARWQGVSIVLVYCGWASYKRLLFLISPVWCTIYNKSK